MLLTEGTCHMVNTVATWSSPSLLWLVNQTMKTGQGLGTRVYLQYNVDVKCAQDLQARFRLSSMGCAMPSVDVILLCAKLAT